MIKRPQNTNLIKIKIPMQCGPSVKKQQPITPPKYIINGQKFEIIFTAIFNNEIKTMYIFICIRMDRIIANLPRIDWNY